MPEITQEELELLNKYKELGEPEAITTALSERDNLFRQATVGEASIASGYKLSVLEKLTNGLELTMKDGQAFVGEQPIEEYANENWQDFLPALKSEEDKKTVKFVSQNKSAVKPTNQFKGVASRYIKNTYATKA